MGKPDRIVIRCWEDTHDKWRRVKLDLKADNGEQALLELIKMYRILSTMTKKKKVDDIILEISRCFNRPSVELF